MASVFTYQLWSKFITDENGDIVPNVSISVVNELTGAPMTLAATVSGGSKTNPFTTGSDGKAEFYIRSLSPTWFRVTATKGSFSSTFRYQAINDSRAFSVAQNESQSIDSSLLTKKAIRQPFSKPSQSQVGC